jgi:hypothetical protein
MPPAGFELAIPASERPQTHALDRAATGIGIMIDYLYEIFLKYEATQKFVVSTRYNIGPLHKLEIQLK